MGNSSIKLKVVVIGDIAVGRSSLVSKFIDDEFDPIAPPTLGVDFKHKTLTVNGKKTNVTFFELNSLGFNQPTRISTSSGAHGVILVYDVTRRETFTNLDTWIEEIEAYSMEKGFVKLLIGNKKDGDCRRVSVEEGEEFAKKHSMMFAETSAKTGKGVHQAVLDLIEKLVQVKITV